MLKSHLGCVRADSLHAAPVFQMLMIGALALGVGMGGHRLERASVFTDRALPEVHNAVASATQSAPAQEIARVGAQLAAAANPPENLVREAEIDDGQDFAAMLDDAGASDTDAAAASAALAAVYPLNKLRAGQDVSLTFKHTDRADLLTGATFQPEDTREITLTRAADGGFSASVRTIPIVRARLAARGVIRSTLYEAGDRAGVPHSVMAALIHVYAHDIDFQRDIHPGDSFEILYDQPRTAQGKPVGEGSIIYAAMHIGHTVKPIYRVTFADKTVDYFDAKGQSVRRALLRTPVAVVRITSPFGMRVHPILGYSKMHKGVDFGAPMGTPIFAAGSGTVEQIGFVNGFGRYIRIRHNSRLETVYGHMSRFNPRLYNGAHVNQGEVIAYVGMSGRATGPHLHFEVHVNGVAVNPMSVKLPTGRVLQGLQLAQFKKGEAHIRAEYAALMDKAGSPAPVKLSSASTGG